MRQIISGILATRWSFIREQVEQVTPAPGKINIITLSTETGVKENVFDNAIICTGAWSKKLLRPIGLDVPLEAERGYHITLPDQQALIKHAVGSAERRFVITPLASGLRVVGVTELGGLEADPCFQRFNMLKHHLLQLLPVLADKPDSSYEKWMGHRPTLPDSLPVIDQHPDYPNLLFAFGNQHLGLTQAAASAELVLSLVKGKQGFMPVHYFSVSRF